MNPALLSGPALAISGVIACLLMSRRQRLALEKKHSELLAMLRWQREESSQQIAQLTRDIEDLEQSRRNVEEAREGFPRSRRAQAIQLLRSGMSPESAATSLGLGTQETRLIAKVSRLLTLQ